MSGDGRVSVLDAALVQRALLQPPTAVLPRPELCDVNGDAACTPADAVVLRRAVLQPPTAAILPDCVPPKP